MRIAHHPQTEAEGQIENFEHLREMIEAGEIKLALDWIDAAIKNLKRNDQEIRQETV